MSEPVIRFNRDFGSDAALASGAGPATAITGTQARANGTEFIAFFGTAPDLSGVSGLGGHVLYVASSSGRRFTKILGTVRDATLAFTCDTVNGSPTLSNCSSVAGLVIGHFMRVEGVSGFIYGRINNIVGSTITLSVNVDRTFTGASADCPKQVPVVQPITLSADTAWAIGGKRQNGSGTGSAQLGPDLAPGWTVVFEYPSSGLPYDFSAEWALSASGDSTAGPIFILGSGAGNPTLKAANTSTSIFAISGSFYRIDRLEFSKADAAIKLTGGAGDLVVTNSAFRAGTDGLNYGVRFIAAGTGNRILLSSCEFDLTSGTGVLADAPVLGLAIENCYFHSGGSGVGIDLNANAYLDLFRSLFFNLNYGLLIQGTAASGISVEGCTFHWCGKGIESAVLERMRGIVIRNSSFTKMSGFGLNLPSGTDLIKGVIDFNNFFANNSNRAGVSAGENDVSVDPAFWSAPWDSVVDPSTSDYRVGTALRGKGWPQTMPGAGGPNVIDVGAFERAESIGGDEMGRIQYVVDLGLFWEFGFTISGGNLDGKGGSLAVLKSELPAAGAFNLEAMLQNLRSALRDNPNGLLLALKEVAG